MLPLIIEIPNYVRKVQMSKSQLNVYFNWNGEEIKAKGYKIQKRFLKPNSEGYTHIESFRADYVVGIYIKSTNKLVSFTRDSTELPDILQSKYRYILCKLDEDNIPIPVIANHTKAGKPRMYLIKGQDIYSGNLREHARGFIMDKIKDCYYPFIKDLKAIPLSCYPVKIKCEVYDTIKNIYDNHKSELGGRWDMDNLMYPYLKAFPDILTREGILKDDDRLYFPSTIPAYLVPIEKHENRKLVFTIEHDDREELKNNVLFQQFHKDSYESEDNELVKDDNEEPFENITIKTII